MHLLDVKICLYRRKSGQSSSRQLTTRPEATPLDFVVRPPSKVDPEEVRARAKQAAQDQHRMKVRAFLSHSFLSPQFCGTLDRISFNCVVVNI